MSRLLMNSGRIGRIREKLLTDGGLGKTTLNQAVILLAGIGSGVTLARFLGPAGRGDLALILLWPGILGLFGDLGVGFALAYYAGKGKDNLDDLWTICLLVGLLGGTFVAMAGWGIVPHFVAALRGSLLRDMGFALISVPLVLANGFQAYLLLGKGLVREYNRVRLGTTVSYLALVLGVALSGTSTVHRFVIAYVAAQAVGFCLSTLLVVLRFRPGFSFNAALFRKVFRYGLQTQMASLAAQANLRIDQVLMSLFLTRAQLGLYVVSVSVSSVLTPFMNALAVVILPRTTHAASPLEGAFVAAKHVKVACVISVPALAIVIAVMPWLLPGFFGHEYAPAIPAARVLAIAGLFQGLNAVLGNSLRGLGRPIFPAIAEGLGVVATLLLLVLLLPPLGILGAAIASLLAYFLVTVVLLVLTARAAGINVAGLMLSPVAQPSVDAA